MSKKTVGYLLVAGAVTVWVISSGQQKTALAAGDITGDQALTFSDRAFSPAGFALAAGLYLIFKG